jgi:hypothetical protein
MRMGRVDIPGELLRAQRAGSLVIFAGAGVSMGPPSNLPNFRGLVNAIAAGTGQTMGTDEPEERFLGRIDRRHANVHDRAAQILNAPDSSASPIHHDLLRLFPSASDVRLVTTNFDPHFDTAGVNVFGAPLETFYEPALPLGDDFSGLVYIHGSASRQPYRFVLTDEDFGRGYLTEGWARRFLRGMYSGYTVLFVGYSHRDVPMHYLARGLPPTGIGPRFALIDADDDPERWRFLRVEPIVYPMDSAHDHSELGTCIATWATLANEGALGMEVRIRGLTAGLPPNNQEDQSYLSWAVENPEAVRFFTRHASGPAWLEWLDAHELLSALFEPAPLTAAQEDLAAWMARLFIPLHSDNLFLLAIRRRGQWNPRVTALIAWHLAFTPECNDTAILAKWVPVLLQEQSLSASALEGLLRKCMTLDAPEPGIALFSHLITPKLEPDRRISYFDNPESAANRSPVTVDIHFRTNHHELNAAWTEYLKPRISRVGEILWPSLVAHLGRAHSLRLMWEGPEQNWDPLSYGRSAVEPHEQDDYAKSEDVLIDAVRDILEWKIANQGDHGKRDVELIAAARATLLNRIAIHGVRLSRAWAADLKIEWLLASGFLFRWGMKHETYLLLRDAFADSSAERRDEVLLQVDQLDTVYPTLEPRTVDYERFNLLSWLLVVCPADPGLTRRINEIRIRNPQTAFAVREYPDLDHWGGASWESEEETSTDEDPRTLSFQEVSRKIQAARRQQGTPWGLPAFLRQVRNTVSEEPDWGIALAQHLLTTGEHSEDAWAAVIQGWTSATLSEPQWIQILGLAIEDDVIALGKSSFAEFLHQSVDGGQPGLPSALWIEADALAVRVWQSPPDQDEPDTEDWLQRALNHQAGKLIRFWLKLLELQRAATSDADRSGIPENLKDRFEMAIADDGSRGAVGVAMLASQLNFLYYIDEQWTRTSIFPLFDWARRPCVALQAWDGFLAWASWNPTLFLEVRPLFALAFTHLSLELANRRERFTEYVAVIALFGSTSPLEDEWLPSFLTASESTDRKAFARHLGFHLRGMTDEQKTHLWNRWLHNYFTMRLTGVPMPLTDAEIIEMIEWAVLMPTVFAEAVNILVQTRPAEIDNSRLFYDFRESELPLLVPDSCVQLVEFILNIPTVPQYVLPDLEAMLRRLIGPASSRQALLRCCERLGGKGALHALDLRDAINTQYG